jgi:NAD+ diphosphatase
MTDNNTSYNGIYKKFVPALAPIPSPHEKSIWFIFNNRKLLVEECSNDSVRVPVIKDPSDIGLYTLRKHYLGTYDSYNCYCAEVDNTTSPPDNMTFDDIRSWYGKLDEDVFWLSTRAVQIIDWDRSFQFCGCCGVKTVEKTNEMAKVCPKCGSLNFPRLSPAIIVAVIRDNKILLAHNSNFPAKRYSVIAGFVEPGETLEECVQREIMEETGIHVKNIKYFGSQPWPFPNSLMLGFTAEYAGGEIRVDNEEITKADWFDSSHLPEIPGRLSISRKLIDWFVENF